MTILKTIISSFLCLSCTIYAAFPQGDGNRVSLDELLRHDSCDAASYVYAVGVKQLAGGDFDEALNSFNYLLQNLDSLHGPTFYQLSKFYGRVSLEDAACELSRSGPGLSNAPKSLEFARRAFLTDTSNMTYLNQLAEAAVKGGQYRLADSLLGVLVSGQVNAGQNSFLQAEVAYFMGDYPRVIRLVDNFQDRWGVAPMSLSLKYEALVASNDARGAQEVVKEAVVQFPEQEDFYIKLGDMSLMLGQDSLAVDSFQRLVALDTTSAQGWILLSEYYRRRNKVTEYIGAIRRVFDLDEVGVEVKAEYFEDSFLDPALYPTYYQDVNELAEALWSKYRDQVRVREMYLKYLLFVGKVEQAREILEPLTMQGEATVSNFEDLISIEMYLKRYDSAIRASQRALKAFPRQESAYFYLLEPQVLYLQQKPPEQIIRCLDRLMRKVKADSLVGDILTMKGDMYGLLADHKKAIGCFVKSLRVRPDHAGTLNNYAYLLAEQGQQLELALEMSERSNELESSNPTFLDTQGWVLYKMGLYEQARAIMQRVLALEAGSASDVIYLHYGDILAAMGESLMAKNYYRKALEAGYDPQQISQRIQQLENPVKAHPQE